MLEGNTCVSSFENSTQLDTLTIEYTHMHDSLTKPLEIDEKIQSVKIKRPTAPRPRKNSGLKMQPNTRN